MGGQSGRCLGGQRQHACTGRIPVVPASRALQRAVGPQLAWCALSARAHDGPGPPKATKWSSGPLVLTYDRERWTPTGSESEQTCAPTARTIRRCHGDIKKQSPFKHYWNNPLKLALSLLLIAFADAVRTTWLLQYLPSCNLRETNPSQRVSLHARPHGPLALCSGTRQQQQQQQQQHPVSFVSTHRIVQ